MDDSDGEGVGGVIGLGDGFELEVDADHFLDLWFVGHAVSADSIFNLIWAIFEDGEIVLFCNEKTDAARLGDRDTGSDVLLEKELFDSHDVGLVGVDNFVK